MEETIITFTCFTGPVGNSSRLPAGVRSNIRRESSPCGGELEFAKNKRKKKITFSLRKAFTAVLCPSFDVKGQPFLAFAASERTQIG